MAEDLGEITVRFAGEGAVSDTSTASGRRASREKTPEQMERERERAKAEADRKLREMEEAAKKPFLKIAEALEVMRGTLSGSGGVVQFLINQRGALGLFGAQLGVATASVAVATTGIGLMAAGLQAASSASRAFADRLLSAAAISSGGAMGAARIRMAELMQQVTMGQALGPVAAAVAGVQVGLVEALTPLKATMAAIWGGVSALLAGIVKAAMPTIMLVLNGILTATIAILEVISAAAESGVLNRFTGAVGGGLLGGAAGAFAGVGLGVGLAGLAALVSAPVSIPVLAIAGVVAALGAIAGGALGYSVGANATQISNTLQETLKQLRQFKQTYQNSLTSSQINNLNLWAQSLFGGLGSGQLSGLGPPRIAPVRP